MILENTVGWNDIVVCYACQTASIFLMYPYRDYVKIYEFNRTGLIDARFMMVRYRGMVLNPHQAFFLAVPWTLLYAGCDGTAAGAALGGVSFAGAKVFVRKLAHRMATLSNQRGRSFMYHSTLDCIRRSTREQGFYSWFAGLCATSLIAVLWHGAALLRLCERRSEPRLGFVDDLIAATSIHGSAALLTTPLRNVFRSALHDVERAGGVKSLGGFSAGERAIFIEAAGVTRHAFRNQHFRFFFEGAFRTVCKTSVPFGVAFALYRAAGGNLPQNSISVTHHQHIPRHHRRL
jgi:hypothetical protein